MKSYRPIKPETVSDGAKDVSLSQKLWEKKHPSHRPTPFFCKRSNPLYVGIQYKRYSQSELNGCWVAM